MRVDAASKVQLLILKKEQPEFYKLKFKNSVECDRWQAAISSAIEVCKEKKFNCGELWCEVLPFIRCNVGYESLKVLFSTLIRDKPLHLHPTDCFGGKPDPERKQVEVC